MQSPPAPPSLQPATQTCGYCARELPLVTRVVPPDPAFSPLSLSRCTICWLLEDLDRAWTQDFGLGRAQEFQGSTTMMGSTSGDLAIDPDGRRRGCALSGRRTAEVKKT